jgi:hypothetical protein
MRACWAVIHLLAIHLLSSTCWPSTCWPYLLALAIHLLGWPSTSSTCRAALNMASAAARPRDQIYAA